MARNAIESEFWTSNMGIDQKWPEMRSKVIFGHPKWPLKKTNKILYRSEMARIAIESEFRKSKMANRSDMARNTKMARNTIESEYRTSKMTDGSHFVKNFQNKFKVAYRSEVARNAIEGEFRTSKMADIKPLLAT